MCIYIYIYIFVYTYIYIYIYIISRVFVVQFLAAGAEEYQGGASSPLAEADEVTRPDKP